MNSTNDQLSTTPAIVGKPHVSGSAFFQEEEDELQRLVKKIKWNQPTFDDMKKADELTRKKWKSQGIG